MRDHYQQQEQALNHATAERQEWEQATAGGRRLAIAADAELRRRHPGQKIEPLRSAEPSPVGDPQRERVQRVSGEMLTETGSGILHLTAQRPATRAAIEERSLLLVAGEDPVRDKSDKASSPAWQAFCQNAILQPPKPEIIPSARILQLGAKHDTEPDYEAVD